MGAGGRAGSVRRCPRARRRSRNCALTLAFATITALASGDTVTLRNGDVLTGEIQEMVRRRLTIETEYSPSIVVEWRAVLAIESERTFDVWLADGQRRIGAPTRTADGFTLVAEDTSYPVTPEDVVRLYPVGDEGGSGDFWEFWDGDIDAGIGITRGNTSLTQIYFGIDSVYRRTGYEVQWDGSSLVSERSESDDIDRQVTSVQVDVFLGDRAFAFGLTRLERDARQRLDLRANLGAGLGWHLVRTAHVELAVLAGSTWTGERFAAGNESPSLEDASIEGLLGMELESDWLLGIEVTSKLTYFPTFSAPRYRLLLDNNVRVPLTRRFTWGFLLYDRFDSAPPPGIRRNDIGLVGTFGFGF